MLVWICWFPRPPGVREGLRFVIFALPGLYSYLSQMENPGKFHISAQNIDCRTQSTFLRSNKKINVYPCKPQFYYIKVGVKGGQNNICLFS